MRSRAYGLGAGLAVLAALHKLLYASVLVNDDFMHRAYGLQVLGGDRPIRDFFDYGMVLMYAVSAAAQELFGYRLFAEAFVIAVMVGISTFLAFALVKRLTDSILAAALSAIVFLVAMPRGYGYPKLIVYAVAAVLWWRYSDKPVAARAVALGLWTAIAFYWRPDHGAYVAMGVILVMISAHGLSRQTMAACARAGIVALALIAPWLIYASVQLGGLGRFVESGTIAAVEEHVTGQTVPRWPVLRVSDLIDVETPEPYAPTFGVRWTHDSSAESRARVLAEYGLTVASTRDEVSQTVRASERTLPALRQLIAEPILEDTDGIERGAARVSSSNWPESQRRRFEHWWLRVRWLRALDEQGAAGEAATILLFALPAAAVAVTARKYLPEKVTRTQLIAFAVFALIVNFGVLRTPFHIRAGDAIVLPAILLGIIAASLQHVTATMQRAGRWLVRAIAVVVVLMFMKSLAVAGQSGERITWLAGEWESLDRARGAWEEVTGRLMSSPPIDYWRNRHPEVTLRLAAYARECVPETDRILVLWFAPEIYYYSERLMAGRHVFYLSQFSGLPFEREMELAKIGRVQPPVVFTREKSERNAREAFPEALDLVKRDYHVAGSIEDNDRYLILVRNDRVPQRGYGPKQWPCYR
jgi:hypothetical protein